MKSWSSTLAAALLALSIGGCGGGGGGGGGGVPIAALMPGAGSQSAPSASAASAPPVTITANGAKLTAEADGSYAVKPGQTVTVESEAEVLWTATSDVPEVLGFRDVANGRKSWSARILHDAETISGFSLSAKYGDGPAEVMTFVFKVAPADARNGTYLAFTAAGAEYKYRVNFDQLEYTLLDRQGTFVRTDKLLEDPEQAGTYIQVDQFHSAYGTRNQIKFRMRDGVLVGTVLVPMPFDPGIPYTSTWSTFPFIGVKKLVTDRSALDGTFNRLDLMLTRSSAGGAYSYSSRLREIRISGQGALLEQCEESGTITQLASCSGGSRSIGRYAGSASSDSEGRWTFTSEVEPQDKVEIAVVRIGGENILVESGFSPMSVGNRVFRVALPKPAAWRYATANGGGIGGSRSKFTLTPTSLTAETVWTTSQPLSTENYVLIDPYIMEPTGFKKVVLPVGIAFALQSQALFVSMGNSSGDIGYLQLGLID